MSLHPKILPTNERPLAKNSNPIFGLSFINERPVLEVRPKAAVHVDYGQI